MVFLAKGICTLGLTKRDAAGNVVEQTPARFETSEDGGCVMVGKLDDETMEPTGEQALFGDYDFAGYLAFALELLAPGRPGNIPDFECIAKGLNDGSGDCPFWTSCNRAIYCGDCIVRNWIDSEET